VHVSATNFLGFEHQLNDVLPLVWENTHDGIEPHRPGVTEKVLTFDLSLIRYLTVPVRNYKG
jgi:hypothetical protein